MDYEKKYKELVGKIEKAYLYVQTDSTKAVLEEIRPELKESEDEKIKKAILNYLKKMWGNCKDNVCGIHVEDAIAWLEKHGEQKTYSWKPTEEQFEALDYAYNSCPDTERGNYYEGVLETLIEDLHRLEKQSEKNLLGVKRMKNIYTAFLKGLKVCARRTQLLLQHVLL